MKMMKIKENIMAQVLTCLLVNFFIQYITARHCVKYCDFGENTQTLRLHFIGWGSQQ